MHSTPSPNSPLWHLLVCRESMKYYLSQLKILGKLSHLETEEVSLVSPGVVTGTKKNLLKLPQTWWDISLVLMIFSVSPCKHHKFPRLLVSPLLPSKGIFSSVAQCTTVYFCNPLMVFKRLTQTNLIVKLHVCNETYKFPGIFHLLFYQWCLMSKIVASLDNRSLKNWWAKNLFVTVQIPKA